MKLTMNIELDSNILHEYQAEVKKTYPLINYLSYSQGILKIGTGEAVNTGIIRNLIRNYTPLPVYNSDVLIGWAMSQVFVASLIPHMAAFLDFANKASEVSKTNFLTYATAVDLVDTANTIINKAIELGAKIVVVLE